MYGFQFLLDQAPELVKVRLQQLSKLRERPDYHPEPNTAQHIELVCNRCCIAADPDLSLAAFLHDICKAETARLNPKTGYPTCPGHDQAAAQLIRQSKQLQDMILDLKADPQLVAWLVQNHMRIKQLNQMRPAKQAQFKSEPGFNLLQALNAADTMLITDQQAQDQILYYVNEHKKAIQNQIQVKSEINIKF